VPSGHRIKLSFSVFHLGAIEAQADCEKVDHIKVRDGNNVNDPNFGTFCGNVAPSPIYSVGPKIEITFVSNEDRIYRDSPPGLSQYRKVSLFSILVLTIFYKIVIRKDRERYVYLRAN